MAEVTASDKAEAGRYRKAAESRRSRAIERAIEALTPQALSLVYRLKLEGDITALQRAAKMPADSQAFVLRNYASSLRRKQARTKALKTAPAATAEAVQAIEPAAASEPDPSDTWRGQFRDLWMAASSVADQRWAARFIRKAMAKRGTP